MERYARIAKLDEAKQIVFAEVYAPLQLPDTQGDFMNAEEIEKMAYRFMKEGRVANIDVSHDHEDSGALVVESFIVRPGDPDFTTGAWVLGVWLPDHIWKEVQDGKLNGFSMFGRGEREHKVLELDIPDDGILKGETADAGIVLHTHPYMVSFDDAGKFQGGKSGPPMPAFDAHTHVIKSGTITEAGGEDGHVHRFSFLEVIS